LRKVGSNVLRFAETETESRTMLTPCGFLLFLLLSLTQHNTRNIK